MNLCAESGIDLDTQTNFVDLGDLDLAGAPAIIEKIETSIDEFFTPQRAYHSVRRGSCHHLPRYEILQHPVCQA